MINNNDNGETAHAAKLPSNISPNPSELVCQVLEPHRSTIKKNCSKSMQKFVTLGHPFWRKERRSERTKRFDQHVIVVEYNININQNLNLKGSGQYM
jgi:hypothetical protein